MESEQVGLAYIPHDLQLIAIGDHLFNKRLSGIGLLAT